MPPMLICDVGMGMSIYIKFRLPKLKSHRTSYDRYYEGRKDFQAMTSHVSASARLKL